MVERNVQGVLSLMKAGLTRRQMLRGMGLSVAAVASAGLLTACETDDDATDDSASDDAAPAAESDDSDDAVEVDTDDEEMIDDADDDHDDHEDEDEGHDDAGDEPADAGDRPNLVIAAAGIPAQLDPYSNRSLVGHMTQYSIFETLVRRDWLDSDPPGIGNNIVPMLAESWEYLDDVTIEFQLRDDVTWHNGDHFDADDVVYSFESLIGEEVPEWSGAQQDMTNLESVEKIDDYTVQLVTNVPDPIFLTNLAAIASYILPHQYYEEVGMEAFGLNPIGTGPYRVVSFTPDEGIQLESHDDYWMGLPNAATVEFRVIPETSARVSALVSGEVHIATNIPPDQIQTLDDADGVHAESIESLNFHMIRFNTLNETMADNRLRQAMCYAIDRELLVDTLWFGEARVPNGHQFIDYPEHLFFEDVTLPYDPERAQELLEEAGYDDELITFRVHPTYYTGYADAAQAIVQMWQEVGINAELELTETPWDAGDDAMVHNWSNSSNMADPLGAIWTNWGPGSPSQANFWDAPERFNELGRDLGSTLDDDERTELWREMLELWMDERPGTPLYNPLETYGVSDVIDWKPIAVPYMDLRNYNLNFTSEDD
jgi:peptide/nickel transport system substrate-binding protein